MGWVDGGIRGRAWSRRRCQSRCWRRLRSWMSRRMRWRTCQMPLIGFPANVGVCEVGIDCRRLSGFDNSKVSKVAITQ